MQPPGEQVMWFVLIPPVIAGICLEDRFNPNGVSSGWFDRISVVRPASEIGASHNAAALHRSGKSYH
jgi:hypothetical protein